MAKKVPILILTGYGVNCEAESSHAWELAGGKPSLVHLNDFLAEPDMLKNYKVLMFIGGFSFGDHMGSGLVFALRLKHKVRECLQKFIEQDNLILGICNGFQVMVKMGLLPGIDGNYFAQSVTLTHNDCGFFQNFWVGISFNSSSPCVFTRNISILPLPIRHGEGKFLAADVEVLNEIERKNLAVCRYIDLRTAQPAMSFPDNPNGSQNAIAGICDPTGRIFGMMPHPEAYLFPENHPNWQLQKIDGTLPPVGAGVLIFRNAVSYLE
jgi:phosphoribosylformylglycinamidine synthase